MSYHSLITYTTPNIGLHTIPRALNLYTIHMMVARVEMSLLLMDTCESKVMYIDMRAWEDIMWRHYAGALTRCPLMSIMEECQEGIC